MYVRQCNTVEPESLRAEVLVTVADHFPWPLPPACWKHMSLSLSALIIQLLMQLTFDICILRIVVSCWLLIFRLWMFTNPFLSYYACSLVD